MRKTRIAVTCLEGMDNFLQWIEPLQKYYEIKVYIIRSNDDVIRAVGFADVIWCEWANESAMMITKYLETTKNKHDKKVIVRLHSYEALAGYPREIKWDYVNHVIYVADHIKEIINTFHNEMNINNRITNTVVPNGIDISDIVLNKETSGKKICSVGAISHKKNPAMLFQIFRALIDKDDEFKLHVAGAYQEARYEIYINHMIRELDLVGKVVMHGNVKDMNKFYADKDFFLLTSVHEGHNVSAIEAMARGIEPVIHNFYGADKQYDGVMRFNTIKEAVDRFIAGGLTEKEFNRQYIINKGWTQDVQVKAFANIIETTLGNVIAGDTE